MKISPQAAPPSSPVLLPPSLPGAPLPARQHRRSKPVPIARLHIKHHLHSTLSRKLALHRQRQLLAALDLFGTSASNATRSGHVCRTLRDGPAQCPVVSFEDAAKRNTLGFLVSIGANKAEIKRAVMEQYGLSRVKSVRTRIQGKDKFAYVVVDDAFDTAARLGFLGTNH
ncbi:hypothetical protein SELMODRAFT_406348 [Selaginella moellendorffii]|uniref:Uncharacterized protein n=1 Tax=Selaginella moellendorffii TaxID=88036 RepID=D8R232_SELML|nr:hypothetical protein SELMODRAFT_406348 [Selaginella moellendorffii]